MKTARYLSLCLLILMLSIHIFSPTIPGRAQGAAQIDLKAIDEFLSVQVKTGRIPGLAVAIVEGDRIIFQKGYGEASPGALVTPHTQFYLGSVSKSFTALAVMKLVQQGIVDLDAPVQKYLPGFETADPSASAQISVRHLLNHTSGLNEKGDPNASAVTTSLEQQVRLMRTVRPAAPTGSRYEYYNQNYRILGLLIEKVSGQSYGDYIVSNIFRPLGMTHSTANPDDALFLAQGYSRVFGFALPRSQPFVPGALPSGYLISTGEDMAKFLIAQLNNRQADGSPLLRPDLLAEMRTPPAGISGEYGMGWLVKENGNTLAHGGDLEYFQSFIALGLKEKVGFVILFNQNSLESMFLENSAVRDGILKILNGKTARPVDYRWIAWAMVLLVLADLANHIRLFLMLKHWVEKTARQPRAWLWIKVIFGIVFPLAILFGLPLMVKLLQGGSPSWEEPLRLIPDLTGWLLVGMSLDLVRSLLHAISLIRRRTAGPG